jgi:hypothetical protein
MKKSRIIPVIVLTLAAALYFAGDAVHAASTLQLSPTQKTAAKDTQFTVSLNIQADQDIYAADAVILYTAADLEVVTATNGNFFDDFNFAKDASNGRIELHGYFANSTSDAKSGNGTFANITFKALKGTGTGTVSFGCSADGSDTFLLTPQGSNILTCSTLNTLTVTYTGSNVVATPTPTTQVGGPQPTATPTPRPGVNSEPSCTGISYLPGSGATTFSTMTIYCQGTDPDGTLNGTQFDFGDGNLRIVSATASDGKISTTYKYAKPGTYGISCKVRDNSGAWSGIPEICKSKISVIQGTTAYTGGTANSTPRPTTRTTPGVPTPTPTIPQIVMMDFVSPTPFIEESADETAEEQIIADENPLQRILLYAGGGISIVAILLFLVKKLTGGPPSNPPVILPPTI